LPQRGQNETAPPISILDKSNRHAGQAVIIIGVSQSGKHPIYHNRRGIIAKMDQEIKHKGRT